MAGSNLQILSFACSFEQWREEYTMAACLGRTTRNPRDIIITKEFSARIKRQLQPMFPFCKFSCKHCDLRPRYGRMYLGYWHCSLPDCQTHVVIQGHTTSSGYIQFHAKFPRSTYGGDGYGQMPNSPFQPNLAAYIWTRFLYYLSLFPNMIPAGQPQQLKKMRARMKRWMKNSRAA